MEFIELFVNSKLYSDFKSLVNQIEGCNVSNSLEMSIDLLQVIIECPIEHQEKVQELAFMTWIKNPEFQKYYQDSKAFKEIAKEYIAEHKD
jgi:hypothetical protein